ncbi:MAG: hypothetical protein ACRD8Z_17980, partial [Nitrososphaeraceae archaeon]
GLAAFFIDSSFLDIQMFLPGTYYPSTNTIFIVISIACIIAASDLLYIVYRNLESKLRVLKNIGILNWIAVLSQSTIIAIFIVTLVQYYEAGTYYLMNMSILLTISYSVALFFMGLLSVKFFSWYRYNKEILVLAYALAICVLVIFLIFSIAYASYELLSYHLTSGYSSIAEQLTFQNFSPNIYSNYYYFSYIITFVSVWVVTILFLKSRSTGKRILLFYFLFSIPLLYFLIPIIPQFSGYINSFIVYSPSLYGSMYITFFSGTGPVAGIVASIALLIIARSTKDQYIRGYLLISAFGLLLFFTINKNPPLLQHVNPPFGIISNSFIGLSCYMIFLGFYTTVVYLSRKDIVIHTVLKQMSKDRLFGSLIRSEQERQITEIIMKSMDSLKREKEIESKDLSVDEIESTVREIRQEMLALREKEKS